MSKLGTFEDIKEEIYGIIYLVYSVLIVLVDYIKSGECCKTKTYSF